ncbi:hypothetical protein K2173_003634 [Erythroxylum novogranatense]|uniref:Gustatory receptor n=1 Tax=Erythroxylum novogranatense TaxID=1862640 RepID=A0AAV8TAL0_9ROSI|nr:hypothetical protein K2173_003634 [Erythroxylum novogranatense]
MDAFTTSDDTHVDSQPSHRCTTLHNVSTPLLVHPSFPLSKSLLLDELQNFRLSLKWCALDHSSCLGRFISYLVFIFLVVIVPTFSSICIQLPSSSPADDPVLFNILVQLPESGLALIAFFTLQCFFNRYGLRQLLFLDGLEQDSLFVRRGYSRGLDKAFRYLACILLPSLVVELAHKVIFFSTVKISFPYVSFGLPMNSIMFVLGLVSWVYRTGMFLLVCVMFRLTCELQILRFEGLHKLFEGHESDAGVIFGEHVRIKKQLSITSHRYRFFIIACLVTITICQLGALLLVLAFKGDKSFFNSGDLVVCSAVQLSGFFLCLFGAARITHRAQGIVSVATRWHMIATSSSARSDQAKTLMPEVDGVTGSTAIDGSSESPNNTFNPSSTQDPSPFQTRQALVAYLQHNNGGITLFGFPLDRGLLHTLFAFEFSLVLWILSKVVVLS